MSSSSAPQNHLLQREYEHNNPDDNNGNQNHNAYPGNGSYRGFQSLPAGAQDPPLSHAWNQMRDQYDVSPNLHAQYTSSWQDQPQQQPNGTSNTALASNGNFYQAFNQSQVPFHNAGYGQPTGYQSYQLPRFDQRVNLQPTSNFEIQSSLYAASRSPTATVAPQALQNRQQLPSTSPQTVSTAATPQYVLQDESAIPKMPAGEASGRFSVTSFETLQKATNAKRLHNFLGVGEAPFNLQITKSTIPVYLPRKSRNEIRRLLANDKDLATKVTKKTTKALTSAVSKPKKVELSVVQGASRIKRENSASSSSGSSSDEDSSSEDEEHDAKPPLPDKRPDTAIDAVKYDTVKALWRSPRYLALDRDDIAGSISAFWEIVRTIRDRWKSDAAAVKKAEEAKQLNELPVLKERVAVQRNLVAVALRSALDQGHSDIIENFGGHLQFMQSLAQFMQDRAVNSDYSGEFPLVILQLLSRCITLTEGALEKTSVGKLLPRFLKRGDDKIKSLAKRIQDNAVAASKKRKLGATKVSTLQSDSSTPKPIGDGAQKSTTVAGVKRPLSTDSASPQPQKKIAGSVTDGDSPSKSHAKSSLASSLDTKASVPAATVSRSKVQPVVTKPSGFFSSLQSAKKSSLSSAGSSAAQVSKPSSTDKLTRSGASSASSSADQSKSATSASSFFASTMASLTKPKEAEPAAKQEETKPQETEEEKAKRLRKEQRRKLRVSFKPESALVEVRYFTHDPDEELGHDASQVLDADDVKSEGQMFKKHHNDDLMDIDEDDEEYSPEDMEEVVKEFREPSLIDFSIIEKEERERLYAPYGGGLLQPECHEKAEQEKREATTLLAIYANSDDVPVTPNEPPSEPTDEVPKPTEFGEPPQSFMTRMNAIHDEPIDVHNQLSTSNLASGFGALTQTSQQPLDQSSAPASLTELEKIFAQFSSQGQQQAATQPSMVQNQPQQQHPEQPTNMSAIFAALSGTQHNQNQGQVYGQEANKPQQAASSTSGAPDLSAILASLTGGGMQPAQAPQMQGHGGGQNQNQNLWFNQHSYYQQNPGAYNQGLAGGYEQQQQPGASGGYPFENEERRRLREAGDTDMYDERPSNPAYGGTKKGSGKQWTNKGGGGGVGTSAPGKERNPNKPTPFKVVPCKYWKEGKCRKGSECTFLHE